MTSPLSDESLPLPPDVLSFGNISLRLARIVPAEPVQGFVPFYHFRMLIADGTDVGHLNLRIGDTEHVRLIAGHIGYEVLEPYRGHGCALEACRAVAPFVRRFYDAVTITCDPDNLPSLRTIEHLGATFLEEVSVPPGDPHYRRGSRRKRRYRWVP